MDEFELLRRLRDEVPQATPADLHEPRAALLRELQQPRRGLARLVRRPVGRLAWGMASGAGLAAVLIVALLANQGVRTAGTPAAAADPTLILRNAALAAQGAQALSARPDQYVFIESVTAYHGESFTCDGKADQSRCAAVPDPTVAKLRQEWLSVDGTRDGLLRERPQAGDAEWEQIALDVCPAGVQRGSANGSAPTCSPQPAHRTQLPTTVDAMLQYLGDTDAFTVAGDLIRSGYVPPAALAAMFEAMTRIPGLTVAQDAVDAAGRRGISVGWQGYGVRSELIFDAVTHDYLGERTIALWDTKEAKQGEIVGQSARLRLAIVDRPGQLP